MANVNQLPLISLFNSDDNILKEKCKTLQDEINMSFFLYL